MQNLKNDNIWTHSNWLGLGSLFVSWESETTYSHWKKPGVNNKDSIKTTGLGSYIIPKGLKLYLLKNTRKLEGTHKRITIQEIPHPCKHSPSLNNRTCPTITSSNFFWEKKNLKVLNFPILSEVLLFHKDTNLPGVNGKVKLPQEIQVKYPLYHQRPETFISYLETSCWEVSNGPKIRFKNYLIQLTKHPATIENILPDHKPKNS